MLIMASNYANTYPFVVSNDFFFHSVPKIFRPFTGEYLKLNDKGIYCCVVCGDEIFSSENKYDSGCGWPAFDGVLNNSKVKLHADVSHGKSLTVNQSICLT